MTAVTFVSVRIGLPSKKARMTAFIVAASMLAAPLAFRVVQQVDASVSALRHIPGLLSADTVDVQSSMSKAGLLVSGTIAVNSIHSGMTATKVGNISLYKSVSVDTDTAIQPLADGSTRVLNIMHSPAAASKFTYDVAVPNGGSMVVRSDGGVSVLDSSGSIANSMPKPWAMDANQNPVASEYSVLGSKLILAVHHAEGNAYPVVADPWGWDTFLVVAGGVVAGVAIVTCGASVVCGVGALAGALLWDVQVYQYGHKYSGW